MHVRLEGGGGEEGTWQATAAIGAIGILKIKE